MDMVEKDKYISMNEDNKLLPRMLWTNEKSKRYLFNSNSGNSLLYALLEEGYSKLYTLKGVKEI